MSRDSSNLARLKLVISVNRRVDRELARYRHMKELFYKAYASLELFHVSVCSTPLLWQVIRWTTCNNSA